MQNKFRKLLSRPALLAICVVVAIAGIGTYVLASSNAQSLPAVVAPARPSLLKPYSLGTAPYQYIGYSGSIEQTRVATGTKDYFAAFVVSSPTSCTPLWGGAETNGLTSQRAADIATDFTALRAAGGEVAVSFGGQRGTELAATCTTAADLTAAYASVIDKYQLTRVDFDIEGEALLKSDVNQRRAEAIAGLRKSHPDLKIWLTLPVHSQGLTKEGVAVIQQLNGQNVSLNGINIMAMNYNIGSKNMGQQAITATQATFSQLQKLYTGTPDTEIWKAIGITVMVGRNDTAPETFTLADANKLHAFAITKGIGMLSMWNVSRDQACPAGDASALSASAAPSTSCSSVQQQPYDFLKALTIPAQT